MKLTCQVYFLLNHVVRSFQGLTCEFAGVFANIFFQMPKVHGNHVFRGLWPTVKFLNFLASFSQLA